MTQCERLKNYVNEFGSITPLQALRDLGIMRLGARVWDLKRQGVAFEETEMVKVKNRWGQDTEVAEYRLVKSAQTELAL